MASTEENKKPAEATQTVATSRPVESTPSVVSPPSVFPVSTSLPFVPAKASELANGLSQKAEPSKIIVRVVKDDKNPNIVKIETQLVGNWTGNWIKGAIRAIEKEYKGIKYLAMKKAAEMRMKQLVDAQTAKKGVGDV